MWVLFKSTSFRLYKLWSNIDVNEILDNLLRCWKISLMPLVLLPWIFHCRLWGSTICNQDLVECQFEEHMDILAIAFGIHCKAHAWCLYYLASLTHCVQLYQLRHSMESLLSILVHHLVLFPYEALHPAFSILTFHPSSTFHSLLGNLWRCDIQK